MGAALPRLPRGLALPRILADVSALIAGGYRRIFVRSAGPRRRRRGTSTRRLVDRFSERRHFGATRFDRGVAAATVKSRVSSAGPLPIFTLHVIAARRQRHGRQRVARHGHAASRLGAIRAVRRAAGKALGRVTSKTICVAASGTGRQRHLRDHLLPGGTGPNTSPDGGRAERRPEEHQAGRLDPAERLPARVDRALEAADVPSASRTARRST